MSEAVNVVHFDRSVFPGWLSIGKYAPAHFWIETPWVAVGNGCIRLCDGKPQPPENLYEQPREARCAVCVARTWKSDQ